MKRLSFLLLLTVLLSVQTFGAEGKLGELLKIFKALDSKFSLSEVRDQTLPATEALVNLFQDREFLPQGAVLHVVGPGQNPYEWVVPRILRRDITVVVFSETADSSNLQQNPEVIETIWNELEEHHPTILKAAEVTKETLKTWLTENQQLRFLVDIGQAPSEGIPQADFVIAMMPIQGGLAFSKHAKPGAQGWIVMPVMEFFRFIRTQPHNIKWQVVPKNPLSLFLAPDDFTCRSVFRGIGAKLNGSPVIFEVH